MQNHNKCYSLKIRAPCVFFSLWNKKFKNFVQRLFKGCEETYFNISRNMPFHVGIFITNVSIESLFLKCFNAICIVFEIWNELYHDIKLQVMWHNCISEFLFSVYFQVTVQIINTTYTNLALKHFLVVFTQMLLLCALMLMSVQPSSL